MDSIFGKMVTLIREVLSLTNDKVKANTFGDKAKKYLLGGKTTIFTDNSLMRLKVKNIN